VLTPLLAFDLVCGIHMSPPLSLLKNRFGSAGSATMLDSHLLKGALARHARLHLLGHLQA
jgi:hypothetical protein